MQLGNVVFSSRTFTNADAAAVVVRHLGSAFAKSQCDCAEGKHKAEESQRGMPQLDV